jgi:hypothetical protein
VRGAPAPPLRRALRQHVAHSTAARVHTPF